MFESRVVDHCRMVFRSIVTVLKWSLLALYCLSFGSRLIHSIQSLVYAESIAYGQFSRGESRPDSVVIDWTVSFGFENPEGTNGPPQSGHFTIRDASFKGSDPVPCLVNQNSELTILTAETQGWEGWTQPTSKDHFAKNIGDPDFLERARKTGCAVVVGLVNELRRPKSGRTVVQGYNLSRDITTTQVLPVDDPLRNPRKWISLILSPALAITDIPMALALAVGMFFSIH